MTSMRIPDIDGNRWREDIFYGGKAWVFDYGILRADKLDVRSRLDV